MISIVIPLYNKQAYIAETLTSVLAQTYRNFELVIVNDGSTDDSVKIARSFMDNRIRIIEQRNAGVSVARNTGIKNSKYNYVAFLDGDDWWAPTFLEEIVKAIAAYPENRIFATGRSRVFLNETERYSHSLLPKEGNSEKINYFTVINKFLPLINSSNSVFKKTIFDEKGYFREGQKRHEDHDLWMRLCFEELVLFININLSFYRKTEVRENKNHYYRPDDFIIYLETLLYMKEKLSGNDLGNFKKYCNRFVLLTYIKNYSFYNKDEDSEVYGRAVRIIEGKERMVLKILKLLPYKNTYPFFKLLK